MLQPSGVKTREQISCLLSEEGEKAGLLYGVRGQAREVAWVVYPPLGGAGCRGHAQVPAFAQISHKWQLGL